MRSPEDTLRDHGLRVTPARVAVLTLLLGRPSPPSHPEVTRALAAGGWDRSTLYRNLVDLAEAGVLRRVDVGDHVWRYELATQDQHAQDHPHFLCTQCGDVSCLPELTLPHTDVPDAVARGLVTVQLRGLCDDCATPPQ